MKARKPLLLGILTGVVLLAVAGAWFFSANAWQSRELDAVGRNEIASNGAVQGVLYPGNPLREARIVEAEDKRLVYVRTVAAAARWRVEGLNGAYRLNTGTVNTLVLPAREVPWTVSDLLILAPQSFVQQPDGSFLLSENIAVLAGATLSFEAPEGIRVRLKSDDESFVSVVALGGSLAIGGSESSKAEITSWDTAAGGPDTETRDGRAYVRVIGGNATFSHADFSDLGFWSGNTGGLALTGTDTVSMFTPSPAAAEPGPQPGAPLLPNTEVTTLSVVADDYSLVTAGIDDVTVTGNAYGIFVTNAEDVLIADTTITGSLVDGLALHRGVSDAVIRRTTSSGNNVDGFSLDRSSTGVVYSDVTAEDNGRNGISLDGQALADGPNAVGTGTREFGGNTVRGSTIAGNERYGIEVSGGERLRVVDNTVERNEVGVVVNEGATHVTIEDNTFTAQVAQSVAVRDGSADTEVTDNRIVGGDTGVYVRNADAQVTGNTMTSISNHGITLVGNMRDTYVAANSVAGYGSKAIWTKDSVFATVEKNELLDWHPAVTVASVVNSVFQPLTFVWLLLATLLIASAVTRTRRLRVRTIGSPYPERVPLTSLSKGIVRFDGTRETS